MNRHWLLFALTALALTATVGCEQAQPTLEQAAARTDLSVNPNLLPPPRPALDNAPDLSGASLVINDATLAKMAADGVPASVLDALRSLSGQQFSNAEDFAEAVRGASPQADQHMASILRNALVVTLADAPPAPEGELSIAAREQAASGQFGIVYFDFDKSNIKPEFSETIKANAQILLGNPNMKVTIEGHCDERGTNEYNLALGQRRAESVRRALIAAGVKAGQLSTISFGEERPAASGHDEQAWSQNRRSAIVIN